MQSISMYSSQRFVGAVLFSALLAASTSGVAQTTPDGTALPPPAAAAGLPPPGPGIAPPPPAADGTAVNIQGTVSRFLINPDGDVDGFLTSDGGLVHFPPHLSTQLTSALRPGDSVQISGWRNGGGEITAQRIINMRSNQQLVDQPPQPGALPLPGPLRGDRLSRLSVQGRVARITTAPRGEPDGVILVDGTVIKLTPPVAQQFAGILRSGALVAAEGYGSRNQYGTALQATAFGAPGNLTQLYDRMPPSP
ncbi:hypothetical protein WM40_12625 [Robbsia andropogonis]|uniref:Secreted protein n=1 Tax=Robbsia andropogonis TaxID=28092 RepID=A0A0F5K0C4_9BURK|nr:hypothetical protein [Robbsia andropogonis]KKB63329.1 hypothetical protein WM40_12625 [Robbsia andropogonis]MCP1118153.1 hypothetical protein [Robbsia andropogonis]MCP1127566.1 hypothetical protein [Robbsia andropogonis]